MPISKRDKKRNQHITHQQDLVDEFTLNRDHHYRSQLVSLQLEMNLITQADPYNPEPLDDSPDEISRMVEDAAVGTPYQAEMSKMAGRWYSEFVHEVNEAKEAKEVELTQLMVSTNNARDLLQSWHERQSIISH
jgi:Sds3-like